MCHLLGSARVLGCISEVAANGGLGEAAAWLVLRQNIYVSLIGQTPIAINLECYKKSQVFSGMTDHAWANKMVFIFAETLTFSEGYEAWLLRAAEEEWTRLNAKAAAWFHEKPDTFRPIYESLDTESVKGFADTPETDIESSPNLNHRFEQPYTGNVSWTAPFPQICMLHAPHVIGLMYYHLTLIILSLTNPASRKGRQGLDSFRVWNKTEEEVRRHLKRCVGLALSNPHVVAANFEASHIVQVCGHCLNNEGERHAAVVFLHGVRAKLGWKTSHIIEALAVQWR
jgi:hypothetical protein